VKLAAVQSFVARAKALRWPHALRRWGVVGALGVAFMLAAAFTAAWFVPAARAELGTVEAAATAARLRALAAARARRDAPVAADPAAQFLAAFAPAQLRHQRVAELMLRAGALGLEARRGEFREVLEPQLGLVRYRVTLPLAGPYAAARTFVEQSLREDNALSLDQLRIERADVQTELCRVELQFSLWMRPDEPGAETAKLALSSAAGRLP
jgi:hypothetical protein